MVATKRAYVYLTELGFKIADDWAKEGYTEFHITLLDPRKARRERVPVRYWKANSTRVKGKQLACPGTPTEHCGHPPFQNKTALDVHERTKKHGPYATDDNGSPGPSAAKPSPSLDGKELGTAAPPLQGANAQENAP